MAYDQSTKDVTIPVGSDLSSRQFQFVSINTSGQLAVTADNLAADGVLLDNHADTQGKPGSIAISGICRVLLGAGVTAGDYLKVASGKAVTQDASNKIVARALVTGVTNDIIPALLIFQR